MLIARARQRAAGLVGQHLHVAREHHQVDAELVDQVEQLLPRPRPWSRVSPGCGGRGCRRSRRARSKSRWLDTIAGMSICSAPVLPPEQQVVEAVTELRHHDQRPVRRPGHPQLARSSRTARRPPEPAAQLVETHSRSVGSNVHPHEEAAGLGVAVLLALDDVAASARQEPGHGVHDSGLVRAGEGEHEVMAALGCGHARSMDRRARRLLRHDALLSRHEQHSARRSGDRGRHEHRPVGRPGPDHPGDPGALGRGRGHRDRQRARGAQEHGVPAGRHPGAARASSSRTTAAASTASASGSCGSPAPPPPGSTSSRRPRPLCKQLAAATGETVNLAVPSDGRSASTSTRSPAPPRCSRTTGSASTSRCTPPSTARCCWPGSIRAELDELLGRLPSYTGAHDHQQAGPAQAARRGPRARGTPSRSTSSRSG